MNSLNFIILSFLIFTHVEAASSRLIKTKKFLNKTTNSYDLNSDGKIDFEEDIENGVVLVKREDFDFDGVFDIQTTNLKDSPVDVFKIVEYKKSKSFIRKTVTYTFDKKNNLAHAETKLDANDDGKWDKSFVISTSLTQHKLLCGDDISPAAEDLAVNVLAATEGENYFQTDFGYRIHNSCLSQNRDWFLSNSRAAMAEGQACLKRLEDAGGLGAARNLASLEALLSNNNVQVLCGETSYNWTANTLAYATTGPDSQNTRSTLTHPGISFNPTVVQGYSTTDSDKTNDFKATFFHEQLHNLGYRHNHDVEYPYTCDACCFPSGRAKPEETAAACKLCGGNYSDLTDRNYLEDISEYGKLSYNKTHALSASIAYVKENRGDLFGMNILALNSSDVFNPIGIELAQVIASKHTLSGREAELNASAQYYKDVPFITPYQSTSRTIANAYYDLYHSGDVTRAISNLEALMPSMIAEFSKPQVHENEQYVKENIKSSLKKIIHDVWLSGYRGSAGTQPREVRDDISAAAFRIVQEMDKLP